MNPPEIAFLGSFIKLFHRSAVHKDESQDGGLLSPADYRGDEQGAHFHGLSVFGDVNPILDGIPFPHLRLIIKANIKPFHNPVALL